MHMHMTPTHDRRRGSSQYRSSPGYAEADAIPDRMERQRALDAVRQAALRDQRPDTVPSPHQLNAILADAVGLALADPTIRDMVASRLGHHIRRAIRARDMDPRHPETKRLLVTRMRPNPVVIEVEAQERVAEEIAAAKSRRTLPSYADTLALFDALRDDESGHEAY